MEWIKIKDAAKLTSKSERTLRHQAVLGRLRCKKEGKDWLVDFNSLKEKGLMPNGVSKKEFNSKIIESASVQISTSAKVETQPRSLLENQPTQTTKNQRPKKSYYELSSLGVYKELLELFQIISCLTTIDDDQKNKILISIEQALFYLAVGFYEYKFNIKIENYSRALHQIAKLIVLAHLLLKMTKPDQHQFINPILEKIMAVNSGIRGLLRKTEMRMNEKRIRTQNSIKT